MRRAYVATHRRRRRTIDLEWVRAIRDGVKPEMHIDRVLIRLAHAGLPLVSTQAGSVSSIRAAIDVAVERATGCRP